MSCLMGTSITINNNVLSIGEVSFVIEFRTRLRAVRMEKKKTQKETAEALGMQLRSYQFYEQGGGGAEYCKTDCPCGSFLT